MVLLSLKSFTLKKSVHIYIIASHLCSGVLKPLFFVPAELHTGKQVTYCGQAKPFLDKTQENMHVYHQIIRSAFRVTFLKTDSMDGTCNMVL